jgi:phosphosulfolactate phosphohydrolase-like enzyme
MESQARFVANWELQEVKGVVVAIDVLRAFTTAAYAFGAGATSILLVGTVAEALDLARSIPGALERVFYLASAPGATTDTIKSWPIQVI